LPKQIQFLTMEKNVQFLTNKEQMMLIV